MRWSRKSPVQKLCLHLPCRRHFRTLPSSILLLLGYLFSLFHKHLCRKDVREFAVLLRLATEVLFSPQGPSPQNPPEATFPRSTPSPQVGVSVFLPFALLATTPTVALMEVLYPHHPFHRARCARQAATRKPHLTRPCQQAPAVDPGVTPFLHHPLFRRRARSSPPRTRSHYRAMIQISNPTHCQRRAV